MTYIITIANEGAIYMASDSRLNYFKDIYENEEKYQLISAIADCIQKTFFINKAKVGIQFLGVGYFPNPDGEIYPISYFVNELNTLDYNYKLQNKFKIIFDFLKNISKTQDTGRYVKGVMAGFEDNKKYVCMFNTYNNDCRIQEIFDGQSVDSENTKGNFLGNEKEIIDEIKRRINQKSIEKEWFIGGEITILEIKNDSHKFIINNVDNFKGTKKELVHHFNNNIKKIKGKILNKPYKIKYNLDY